MEKEVPSGSAILEVNEKDIQHEMEKTRDVEDKLDVPKRGMEFDSIDEIMSFYTRYARQKGFAVSIRTSKKVEGILRYVTIACTRAGRFRIRSSNLLAMRPQSKNGCQAKITVGLDAKGKYNLNFVELAHNHEMSTCKSRFYKSNRLVPPHVKKRPELYDKAGIRMNKNFNSVVVEAGGRENLSFLEKDCRNYNNKVRCLQLGEGDATAMHDYFLKMQADNAEFFYMMDLDTEGRLRNVFWADARSRAAFKEFGDVVTFDTTYLVNKYDMPFALFVGVNHHGQSTLLGCGLISSEDTATFTWLFQSWLTCMSRNPPNAIVTDQDKAMQNAIEVVFPNARHRWCLWHIMKKLPEKLRGYNEYESIKFLMQNVVYDSLTKEEFEDSWGKFIEKYHLQSNNWLLGLYDERHRWVPAFVKDNFWAGMSTTRRSESMHAFFDGYINSKTSLKQFVEQYENALAKKVENETQEEFRSSNSVIPCISPYQLEKQFQSVYTIEKFKEFQNELRGKIYCNLSSSKEYVGLSEYEIREDVPIGEGLRRATFKLHFNHESREVNCNCRLFEFRGIMCRHQIVVYTHREIDRVPDKYIFQRWSKIVKRSHTKVRISYDNWFDKLEARRFDNLCNEFYEVADAAAASEDSYQLLIAQVRIMKARLKEMAETRGSNRPISSDTLNVPTSCGDGLQNSKESRNIHDPLVHREKAVKKKQKVRKKIYTSTSEKDSEKLGKDLGTQESFNINSIPRDTISSQPSCPQEPQGVEIPHLVQPMNYGQNYFSHGYNYLHMPQCQQMTAFSSQSFNSPQCTQSEHPDQTNLIHDQRFLYK